ncbi:MAG TPA: MvaI/BcnI family restriction endonuclease [Candidatus Lokiarchaeia archaeon]|nr:MvaI/BcnI family restriction endonuclease [Candidatus Lokiarchaeia archaeon]
MAKKRLGNQNQQIDIEKAKAFFINDFRSVKARGFIPSSRKHNTGVGKTFEDVMNVKENNLQSADYKGCIEFKAQRGDTDSMLTLFSKSPSFPKGANKLLRDHYGSLDPETGYNKLHTTIQFSSYNTFQDKWGFKLDINEEDCRIEIKIKNLSNNKLEDTLIYYTFDALKKIVVKKCRLIAYIATETRERNGKEEFYFKHAKLLTNMTWEKFIECLKQDIIKYDIRIGAYRSGKNKGKIHDHGSGFRILKESISREFDVEEID